MNKHYLILAVAVVVAAYVGFQFGSPGSVQTGMHVMDDNAQMRDDDMDGMMRMMSDMLDGKKGAELDRAFLAGMITHHQGAVAMCQPILKDSSRQELKSLCRDIISAQTREIEMMKKWQLDWSL